MLPEPPGNHRPAVFAVLAAGRASGDRQRPIFPFAHTFCGMPQKTTGFDAQPESPCATRRIRSRRRLRPPYYFRLTRMSAGNLGTDLTLQML